MLNPKLPNDLTYPNGMGLREIAVTYNKSVSTMQRVFKRVGVYDLFDKKDGRAFTPDEILVIFSLHYAPSKFYSTYIFLEESGYIKKLRDKFDVEAFLLKRKKSKIRKQ